MKALIVFQATPHSQLGMSLPMHLVSVSSFSSDKYKSVFYLFIDLEGKWGIRIRSALAVRKVKVSFGENVGL